MTANPTDQKPASTVTTRTAEADSQLDRAARTHDDYGLRQARALAGIGQALLALAEQHGDQQTRLQDQLGELGERAGNGLADIADAVTGVQEQLAVLCDQAPVRRPWLGRFSRRREAGRLSPADTALITRALADAASWCRVDECSDGAENERLAFAYLALRERLGGGAW